MAYSDFTLPELKKIFGLVIHEKTNLFENIAEIAIPATLADILRRYVPLAVNLNTEKARSELIIAPVLAEFKLLHWDKVSMFSGIEFNVDDATGLRGRCDYILSLNPEQLALTAPVCVVVEAKNENIVVGIPQCLAGMVAAIKFNEAQEVVQPPAVYGAVTTGMLWRFLKIHEGIAYVDTVEYSIYMAMKIFAILTSMVLP